jgi:AAA family ATP:ADP antiporter
MPADELTPSYWERRLRPLADVRAGEGRGALLLMLNVFLLLFGYYLLKTVREALILVEGGAYIKAYSSAAQAVLLMALVPLYGYVGTRVPRIKLITGLFLFFASNLIVFYAIGIQGVHEGIAFYIWVGIFNVFVVSQIWAFANDIYTEDQGKRLFPMIGIGASLGAWLGAQAAERMVSVLQLDPYRIQLVACALLAGCCFLTLAVNRLAPKTAPPPTQKLAAGDGFKIILGSRYLLWIALLTVLLNIVNSTGEFLLGSFVSDQAKSLYGADEAAQKQFVGAFYGDFFAAVNLLGFLLQAFAASRLFQWIGVRGALFLLPSIALASYSLLAMVPVLGLVRWTKTLENATDYSIQNTIRQALFLPTSREAKYKAKAAIDTFFMRLGDVIQAGVVRLGAELQLAFSGFAWLNIGLTLVWLWVAARESREHRRMA